MSNLLQYTIQLKDQMSTTMDKVGAASHKTNEELKDLQNNANKTQQSFTGLYQSTTTLGKSFGYVDSNKFIGKPTADNVRRVKKEVDDLDTSVNRVKDSTTGLHGKFSNLINAIPFGNILTNPLFQAGIIGGQALRLGIQDDFNKASFEVLLGSEAAAKNMRDDILKYALDTPYDKLGLSDNVKTMLGFGVATDKVMPSLKALGEVAMGDKNRLNSLTLAYAQMTSAGKLQGQDLLQMVNAGFNPLKEMSKITGKSIAVLRKEMEQGAISSKMVEDAFLSATGAGGMYHGMTDKLTETLGGQWAKVQEEMNEKLLTLYELLGPIATRVLKVTMGVVGFVEKGLGKMFSLIKEGNPWMWGLVTVLGAYAIGMGAAAAITAVKTGIDYVASGALRTLITNWWALNSAMYANPVGLIIAGVVALIAVIGYVIYKTDGWGKMWQHTVQGSTIIWNAFSTQAKSSFDILVNGIMIGINRIQQGWYQFKNAVGLGDSGENNSILNSLDQEIEGRKKSITDAQNAFNNASYKGAGKAFGAGLQSLSWNSDKSLGSLIGDTKSKLGIAEVKTGLGTGAGLGGGVETTLGKGKGKQTAAKTNSATTTGGQKSNYITINLDALIKGLQITTQSNEDSANQVQNQTTDALLRVLAMATTAAGS